MRAVHVEQQVPRAVHVGQLLLVEGRLGSLDPKVLDEVAEDVHTCLDVEVRAPDARLGELLLQGCVLVCVQHEGVVGVLQVEVVARSLVRSPVLGGHPLGLCMYARVERSSLGSNSAPAIAKQLQY